MFPQLARFIDLRLLLLRLTVALVFVTSGWSQATKAEERSKGIDMSKGFTVFLGVAEIRRRTRGRRWFSNSARRNRVNPDYARCNSEEDFRVAHGFLGRKHKAGIII
jgi:hypothetical protein